MTTSATRGQWDFYTGTNASPIVYTELPEVLSVSGIGQTNPLIDATSFDSTAREYIAGLADGSEIAVECNYIATNAAITGLMTSVDSGATINFKATYTATSPNKRFTCQVVALSYEVSPNFSDKNTIKFSLKISGAVTRS